MTRGPVVSAHEGLPRPSPARGPDGPVLPHVGIGTRHPRYVLGPGSGRRENHRRAVPSVGCPARIPKVRRGGWTVILGGGLLRAALHHAPSGAFGAAQGRLQE